MPSPQPAPYGSWSSPLSASTLASGSLRLQEPRIDGTDVYWLESRPSDAGRVVLVRRTDAGDVADLTAAPYNLRSRVHEYGGGSYDVGGGVVCFCNFDDRRVYRLDLDDPDAAPRAITPEGELRYGDLVLDAGRHRLYAVCEDHGGDGEPANRLVALDIDGDNEAGGRVLVSGPDFVAFPAPSADGALFAWMQWDHPHMPWDESEIWLAPMDADGGLGTPVRVAGGAGESVSQPTWSPSGGLVLVSDRTGFWNLYEYAVDDSLRLSEGAPLWTMAHDFAGPAWSLGARSYGFAGDGTLVCSWLADGSAHFGTIGPHGGQVVAHHLDVAATRQVAVSGDSVVLVAGYVDRVEDLLRLSTPALDDPTVLRSSISGDLPVDPADISVAEAVTWEGPAGTVHGFYFAPRNSRYVAPADSRPPLIVSSHGGPTALRPPTLDLGTQYWTTRGIAVLEVNYSGSSGYGRAYRERLRGEWGVLDVAECAGGARAMVDQGKAHPSRLAIHGGSAGGYTTLAALAFTDVFGCGASYFGIGDLETLARDTHKFESRYLDGLVGPYPERVDLYRERSPIHHVDELSCPLIILQGRDDLVVPLNQAEEMADAVRAKGLPVALLVFDGEGHGFRRADTLVTSMEAELYFYSRVFGFDLGDPVPPIEIENLPVAT